MTDVDAVWALLAGPHLRRGPQALIDGSGGELSTAALPVVSLATVSVGVSLLAASALAAERNESDPEPVTIDRGHVATAFRSEQHARVNGAPVGASFGPLSRFWRASDGWIRTHANYPWHEARLLSVLGCGPDVEEVGRAIATWRAGELEQAIFDAKGCAAMARDPDEWLAHPQGSAVAAQPLLSLRRTGDAPPRRRRPATHAAEDVRVLDLTRVIAGPVCTRTLAAHGADVLRVDSPTLPELEQQAIDSNPGKRSAALDFATERGRAVLDGLLADADVVVIGYRPGSLARFGLSPDVLADSRPGLVVVTLCAWGEQTPWEARRGFDSLVQAASGIARVEARDRDEPGVLPAQALDHATGYFAAAAALCALARQARDGGTWHARLSLAHTAAWLLRARRAPRSSRAVGDVDPSPYMVDLERDGDVVSLVAPPGMLGTRALEWPGPPPVLGADAPEWRTPS